MAYDIKNLPKRPNKNASGFLYTDVRRNPTGARAIKTHERDYDMSLLNTRGTCDRLGCGRWLYIKKVKIEHPIDKGYFKEAYVLTDKGKNYFRQMKSKYNH